MLCTMPTNKNLENKIRELQEAQTASCSIYIEFLKEESN